MRFRVLARDEVKGIASAAPRPHNPPVNANLPSLAGLSKPDLAQRLVTIGVEAKKAKMRAEQLWGWIYHYGVTDFAA